MAASLLIKAEQPRIVNLVVPAGHGQGAHDGESRTGWGRGRVCVASTGRAGFGQWCGERAAQCAPTSAAARLQTDGAQAMVNGNPA